MQIVAANAATGGECEGQRGDQFAVERQQHRLLGLIGRIEDFGCHHGQHGRAQHGPLAARLQLRDLLRQQLFGLQPLPGRVAVVL